MTTQRGLPRPDRPKAPLVQVLARSAVLAVLLLAVFTPACSGDDAPITFIGVVDATPPRLGIVADAGAVTDASAR